MAKIPKRPKLKKLPKKPKTSASLTAWKAWEDKASKIQKDNAGALKDYERKVAQIKSDEKKKASIVKKSQSLGAVKK